MVRLFLSILILVTIGLGLSSCGNRTRLSRQQVMFYDVRQAVVTANGAVPLAVMAGVQRRLDSAIRMTVRPVAMPRIVMNVRIDAIRKGLGIHQGRSEADIAVTLSAVDDGQPFQTIGFRVYSFTLEPGAADEAMAEAIAGRLRYAYSLSVPPIRQPTYRQPRISTWLSMEEPRPGPLIIPTRQVRKIGADADPVLNSKTVMDTSNATNVDEPKKTREALAVPAGKSIDDGASGKVVIHPGNQPSSALDTKSNVAGESDEPCVETLENKCPGN
jgi:hypothetical protein